MSKSKRKIITGDCETDPFKKGRIPAPFVWGLFDGENFSHYESADDFVRVVSEMDAICYMHNGGKFDYHYLFEYFEPYSEVLIINGRLAKFKIGRCEFRDSYSIIPVPLRELEKDEFDYSLLEKDVRYKTDNWRKIIHYLKNDCVYLHKYVLEFINEFGLSLTVAGVAMKQWQKISGRKPPRSDAEYYTEMNSFYYGGRVQCFQTGIIEKPFKVYDINSAYSFGMLTEHPIGLSRTVTNGDIDCDDPHYGASFFKVLARSRGAFPCRVKNSGLTFPNDNEVREYHVTGWELIAARETDTADILDVIECHSYIDFCDFKDFVLHFFEKRRIAKESKNKAGDVFNKLVGNALYGKFGSNPDEYESNMVIPASCMNDLVSGGLSSNGQVCRFSGELGPWLLSARDLNEEETRFFNVATSASITGLVRSHLWRSICQCGIDNVLYCDTDSISAVEFPNGDIGEKLGQWKLEGEFKRAGIAGKKLYIMESETKDSGKTFYKEKGKFKRYKTASKGAKLSESQLWRIAKGKTVLYEPENPSYSIHNGIKFVNRNIRSTNA